MFQRISTRILKVPLSLFLMINEIFQYPLNRTDEADDTATDMTALSSRELVMS